MCQICYFECRNKELLLKHRKLHENRSKLECLWCSASFEGSYKLRCHVRNQHNVCFSKYEIIANEIDFIKLASSELTYKEIAEQMNISPRTADSYREVLFTKLNVKSRTGLVIYAIKNGWVNI
ncbi:MAG: response regulator transcription factor [Chitinophagaceae bacterium]|nr:MAG: response regulator transcription factor [Chitinophagaceae bacterium]